MNTVSVYIHIPFCKKKCNYCDFVSFADKEELIDGYVEALKHEITSIPQQLKIKTIFFGGGTPSLLAPKQLEKILSHFESRITYPEISIECNPGTVNLQKLKDFHKLGINRLSIGAQSFNDRELKTLGRIHTAKEIHETVENARKAGFKNVGLDLIFALPNQTLESWKETVRKAVELEPEHLSTYNLQIEEGTPFWKMTNDKPCLTAGRFQMSNNNFQLPDEETEACMYEFAIDYLKAKGYKHYEISNFSKPGYECKHNIVYWKNGDYIGIGVNAASHINNSRHENPNNFEEYFLMANQQSKGLAGKLASRPARDEISETIMMNLRLLDGLSKKEFKERFGKDIEELYKKEIDELEKDNLIENTKTHLKLSRKGLFLANLIFEKFVD
ncbi:MAG: oxygen-independent coproporphyrinogen III oxidase [Candidatus Saganbacteria bacterium]|uniref:Heme chaperone HemW n=1 Tax=Candidatus Saganbacteria bacterium TaxID=2575572 RepID=A0A833L0V0_UNCSA|nr:MAG: oxygen-independent coproporphyrinogen III oxidase [Candidatus Saganbacteria bacterium]